MTGFKTWADNEVLDADDLNGYLMRQSVIVCTSGAEEAAISAPHDGMMVWRSDAGSLRVRIDGEWKTIYQKQFNLSLRDFNPSFASGLVLGTGGVVLYARYSISDGWCNLGVGVRLGSSGFTVGAVVLNSPVKILTGQQFMAPIGDVMFIDAAPSLNRYRGSLYAVGASQIRAHVQGTNGLLANVGAASPFTWAASDELHFSARFLCAL